MLPDVISYNATITSCERGRQWQMALHLFSSMSESTLVPNIVSYSAAINCFGKVSHWKLALHFFPVLALPSASTQLHHLQLYHQCMWQGVQVASGLAAVPCHENLPTPSQCRQLQCNHQFLRQGRSTEVGMVAFHWHA